MRKAVKVSRESFTLLRLASSEFSLQHAGRPGARWPACRDRRLYHISRLCTEIDGKFLANSKERWLLDKALGH
eukprot:3671197-Prymnesium_polylepis.1